MAAVSSPTLEQVESDRSERNDDDSSAPQIQINSENTATKDDAEDTVAMGDSVESNVTDEKAETKCQTTASEKTAGPNEPIVVKPSEPESTDGEGIY